MVGIKRVVQSLQLQRTPAASPAPFAMRRGKHADFLSRPQCADAPVAQLRYEIGVAKRHPAKRGRRNAYSLDKYFNLCFKFFIKHDR
jgi:hypothetical protein